MRRSLWLLPLAAGLVFGSAELPKAQAGNLGDAVEPSNAEQLSLARELKHAGVIFYGAWWCGACFHQKNLFGTEAGVNCPMWSATKMTPGVSNAAKLRSRPSPPGSWGINALRA